jgi:hypothetical protein
VAGRTLYERTRALLAERGFVEEETRYDEEAFGSWLISVDDKPRLRILWDGRDGWLIIQGELLRVRPDDPWTDLWIGKQPEDVTAAAVVMTLEAVRDFAAEARENTL